MGPAHCGCGLVNFDLQGHAECVSWRFGNDGDRCKPTLDISFQPINNRLPSIEQFRQSLLPCITDMTFRFLTEKPPAFF
jgi:hypothetical protein